MDVMRWDQLSRGVECPFDAPRPDSTDHWEKVAGALVAAAAGAYTIWRAHPKRFLSVVSDSEWWIFTILGFAGLSILAPWLLFAGLLVVMTNFRSA